MYEVTVESSFSAAHRLPSYKGKPEPLHGHNYRVAVTVLAPEVDGEGMAFDFTDLRAVTDRVLSRFNRSSLNDVPPFDRLPPSAEHLARTIYFEIKEALKGLERSAVPSSVTVWETDDYCVRFSE